MTTRTKPVLLLTVLMLLAVLVALGDSWAHPPGQSEIDRNLALAPVPLDLEGKDLALVARGSYIVNAQGDCTTCHTVGFNAYLPGGNPFRGEPERIDPNKYLVGGSTFSGGFISRNLRPDACTGRPANLTFDQFLEVMHIGTDHHDAHHSNPGTPILQTMPWPTFGKMTNNDLLAVYTYLSSLPRRDLTGSGGRGRGGGGSCRPELLHVMDGIGADLAAGADDTFISPLGENVPLDAFTFHATEAVTLISSESTMTGAGGQGGLPLPGVSGFTSLDGGLHVVELDPPPAPGQWLRLDLSVTGSQSGGTAVLTVWLAHLPCDQDQSGDVTISDMGAYGTAWRASPTPLDLVDHDGDGTPTASDQSAWGASFSGLGGRTAWGGLSLPDKP